MNEYYYHINVYQSIEEKLEYTEKFVSHICDSDNNIIFGDVYSFEFQHLLTLIAVEFETVSKLVCKHIDSNFKDGYIIKISNIILNQYPGIRDISLKSKYMNITPLKEWRIEIDENGNDHLIGLDWWRAYNKIKHDGFDGFKEATLKNVIYGMASLYIMELYYIQGAIHETIGKKSSYFSSDYELFSLAGSGPLLPDIREEINHS